MRSFTFQFVSSLGVRAFGLIAGFLISILIARAYGSENLGQYALFVVHLNLLTVVAKCGLDTWVVREGARFDDREVKAGYVRHSLGLAMVLSLALIGCYALLLISGWLASPSQTVITALFYMLLALPGAVLIRFVLAWLRLKGRTIVANALEGVGVNGALLICLLTVYFSSIWMSNIHPIGLFALCTVGVGAIAAVLSLLRGTRGYTSTGLSNQATLAAGLPFLLVSFSATLNTSIDTLSISHYLPEEDLALYSAAQKLAALLAFPLVVAGSIVAPQFSALFASSQTQTLRTAFIRTSIGISIVSGVGCIIVLTLGEQLLGMWGDSFIDAYDVLIVLGISQLINACCGPLGLLLNMSGYERPVLWITLFNSGLNLLLNATLIPSFGIKGAALATGIVIVLQNVAFFGVVWRNRVLSAA
ncbi:oligosaccharide flippase family protein [Aestuariibacter halophilus]|uniref:Oligosaccharide flippase family protein n=1 Tax=Fluctibacter halophilus TaxID=226011 RepID=A0ABS8GDK9_9ALTE|nr:oligosaccharide flippase family protein [Aestuariibacter halophilus]MCC2618341.1 oligosaccharide flippase family protein [Aestuariibacter halophilus]